jgi:hypothetical protein
MQETKNLTKQKLINPVLQWYAFLFEQRMDDNHFVKCFECGKKMSENTWKERSTCYSHIFSKKTYPLYKGKEWNVKIVHPDCHHLYTIKPSEAHNQYTEYLRLLELHYKNELI